MGFGKAAFAALIVAAAFMPFATAVDSYIPAFSIVPWFGNISNIPSGFTRYTAWDGKYLLFNNSFNGTSVTGGNESHSHTALAHNHSIVGLPSSGLNNNDNTGSIRGPPAAVAHGHNAFNSSPATVTLNQTTNNPAHVDVIWIQRTTIPVQLPFPVGGWAFKDSANSSGWIVPDEPKGRFLRGADAGQNGTTILGDDNHTHGEPKHSHAGRNSSSANSSAANTDTSSAVHARNTHNHNVSLGSSEETIQNSSLLPAYMKLLVVKANETTTNLDGIIVIWPDTITNIPVGWELYPINSSADFIRGAENASVAKEVGGNKTHTHVANPHNHTATDNGIFSLITGHLILVGTNAVASISHSHVWQVSNNASTIQQTLERAGYPPYAEAVLIKKSPEPAVSTANPRHVTFLQPFLHLPTSWGVNFLQPFLRFDRWAA